MLRSRLILARCVATLNASCSTSSVISLRHWSEDRFGNSRNFGGRHENRGDRYEGNNRSEGGYSGRGGFGDRDRQRGYRERQDGFINQHQRGGFRGSRGTFNTFNFAEVNDKEFEPIQKDFYQEHPSVASRNQNEINKWMAENDFQLHQSKNVQRPIFTFEEANFPEPILNFLKQNYERPSPIQCVSWPNALNGRDLISIAQTGSGKTLGFILPGIVHSLNQPKHDSPNVLVLTPTRELCQQVYEVSGQIAKIMGLKMAMAYGGSERRRQEQIIMEGPKILVATPGRLMDFIDKRTLDVSRTSYVVLDEADRMLDMGFMPQITNILKSIRHDRQLSMFSATWPQEVRELANRFINNPVHLSVGSTELRANSNITQKFEFVNDMNEKFERLVEVIKESRKDPTSKVLVFCGMKRVAEAIMHKLRSAGLTSTLNIHGDKTQKQRDFAMNEFRKSACRILIATDVAARGIDVADISHVINYDMPKNIEDYVHRIGRTARGQRSGTSITFFDQQEDFAMAEPLVEVLEEAGQPVPKELNIQRGNKRAYR